MLQIFVLSCVAAVALAGLPPLSIQFEGRIVNGSPIDISKVPYQVAVGDSGSIWCGGSIISKRYIVTAAHCFNDHPITGVMAFVGVTSLDELSHDNLKPVKMVKVHPNYNQQTHNVDIAILELQDDLVFSAKAQAVGLPVFQSSVPIGAFAYASGWGKLSESAEQGPMDLQGVGLQLLAAESCNRYSNFDKTFMLCAGAIDGSVDTCGGDSGGPLVYDNVLYGATSFGRGCASPGFPGVYANIVNLRDWITQITGL